MPAITITAINTTTEVFTATAHGLTTGDRFRLRNVGGALPAATPALAAVTDYFAIRVDADNIKVSDTNAHALANTGIVNLTGSLTGTTTIEYGLPFCVPTALAVANTQIKSANDTGAWNALVAIYDLLTGQAQAIWTGITLPVNQHVTVSGTGAFKHGDIIENTSALNGVVQAGAWASGIGGSNEVFMISTGASTLLVPLPLKVGDRIKSVSFNVFGDGAADVTTTVIFTTAAMSGTSIGTTTTTNQAASWSTVTIDVTDTTVAATELVHIVFAANATNIRIGNISFVRDRP